MNAQTPSRPVSQATRFRRLLSALVLCGGCLLAARAAAHDKIVVTLDQAQVLKLPAHTSIVVLGNPIIADVTLLKRSDSMILTGKSFGQTNLIALDAQGQTLGQSTVEVVAPATDLVVQLGTTRQSYACDPHCQPTFDLGDDSNYVSGISKQIESRNTLALPKR